MTTQSYNTTSDSFDTSSDEFTPGLDLSESEEAPRRMPLTDDAPSVDQSPNPSDSQTPAPPVGPVTSPRPGSLRTIEVDAPVIAVEDTPPATPRDGAFDGGSDDTERGPSVLVITRPHTAPDAQLAPGDGSESGDDSDAPETSLGGPP